MNLFSVIRDYFTDLCLAQNPEGVLQKNKLQFFRKFIGFGLEEIQEKPDRIRIAYLYRDYCADCLAGLLNLA